MTGCSSFEADRPAPRSGEFWNPKQASNKSPVIKTEVLKRSEPLVIDQNQKLNLGFLVDFALRNNPSTRQAWEAAKSAAANQQVVNAIFFPSAAIGINGQRSSQGFYDGSSQTLRHAITDTYAPNLQLNYLLFNFGGNLQNSRAAREAFEAANHNYNRALQDLILGVAQSYYNLSAAQASVEASQFSLNDAKQVHEASQIRLDAGLGTLQDLLRAEANMRETEFQHQASLAQLESSRSRLAQVIGTEVSPQIQIEGTTAPESMESFEKDVTALTAQALAARPDLLAAYANAQSRESALKAAKSALWPQLVMQFNGGLTTVRNRPLNPTRDWTAGIAVTWDIFDGFRKRGLVKLAESDLSSARERVRQAYYQVVGDVWSAFYSLEASRQQTTAARAQLQAAQAGLDLTQTGYQNGLNTLLELVASQNDLAGARNAKIQAENNLLISLARLANAIGQVR